MEGVSELWEAIAEGDEQAVRRFLRERPELVEATGKFGETPLMRAASLDCRTVPVIRAILEAGADVNRQTREGYTALHYAIDVYDEGDTNPEEIIAVLVTAGADLNVRQHYGWTPLLRAVVEGKGAEVRALLAAGANPNETMPLHTLPAFNAGRTTLMGAIPTWEAEAKIEALLRAGADPTKRDGDGMTFFDYAEALQQECEGTEFAAKVKRCADIARNWRIRDRT
jgi:ankyrin repeat protein